MICTLTDSLTRVQVVLSKIHLSSSSAARSALSLQIAKPTVSIAAPLTGCEIRLSRQEWPLAPFAKHGASALSVED